MRLNRVKQLWKEGKLAIGGFLSIPHTLSAEMMAHTCCTAASPALTSGAMAELVRHVAISADLRMVA